MISNLTQVALTTTMIGTAQACKTAVDRLLNRPHSSPKTRRALLGSHNGFDTEQDLTNEWFDFYALVFKSRNLQQPDPRSYEVDATKSSMNELMDAIPKQLDEESNIVYLDDAKLKIAYKQLEEGEFVKILKNYDLDELDINFLMDSQWNDGLLESLGKKYSTQNDFLESLEGIASSKEIDAIKNNLESINFRGTTDSADGVLNTDIPDFSGPTSPITGGDAGPDELNTAVTTDNSWIFVVAFVALMGLCYAGGIFYTSKYNCLNKTRDKNQNTKNVAAATCNDEVERRRLVNSKLYRSPVLNSILSEIEPPVLEHSVAPRVATVERTRANSLEEYVGVVVVAPMVGVIFFLLRRSRPKPS